MIETLIFLLAWCLPGFISLLFCVWVYKKIEQFTEPYITMFVLLYFKDNFEAFYDWLNAKKIWEVKQKQ